jgi:hypothetical protein
VCLLRIVVGGCGEWRRKDQSGGGDGCAKQQTIQVVYLPS